jgi:hypothetical protein
MDHCLSLRIMAILEKMQPNYSVACYKGNWDDTLATGYNHKTILVDDTYFDLFPNLKIFSNLVTPTRNIS